MPLTHASAPTTRHPVPAPAMAPVPMIPREPRSSVILTAVVAADGDAPPSRHRVRNISEGGMRIDQSGDLRVGVAVRLTIGTLTDVAATIVWASTDSAGLAFAKPIDLPRAKAKTAAPAVAMTADAAYPALAAGSQTTCRAGWFRSLRNPYGRG